MNLSAVKHGFFVSVAIGVTSFSGYTQSPPNTVTILGEMKNVMWKGELQGILDLDTISNKSHLYGLGPVEYLAGEVMIADGKSYKSTVISEDAMRVEETFDIKAPFFAYANIPQWSEATFPDSVLTIPQIEAWLDERTKNLSRPFLFR